MKRIVTRITLGLVIMTGLLTGATSRSAFATQNVGVDDKGWGPSQVSFGSILPVVTEFGRVSLSVDGLGTLNSSGPVGVDKPAGATVRKAYLAAATTAFSGYQLQAGDVGINGFPVTWSISTQSGIHAWNYWADVTGLVKPAIDAAPSGRMTLSVTEAAAQSGFIDGEILAVIFDDPNQTTDNTVVLLFGAQAVGGDHFAVHFANPLDKSDPALLLDMSLGIASGYQDVGYGDQTTLVDVNGQRLTSSAGGNDDMKDSPPANGDLLTVGGLGDTDSNPDPYVSAATNGARTDDELYDLRPFVSTGDTAVNVFTQNPSQDDNLFFSAFNLHTTPASARESITLGPTFAENPLGTPYTAVASLQNGLGNPVVGRDVTFRVTAGPDMGLSFITSTDASGQASFTFTGQAQGNDYIQASFVNSQQATVNSNTVIAKWLPPANQPPTADAGGPYTVSEGGTVTLAGSGTDPDGDQLVYAWDLDNNGLFETGGQNATFSAAGRDGPGSQMVGLQVCDSKVACATTQTSVSILNVAPSVDMPSLSPSTASQGSAVTASVNFSDPGIADTHTVAWNWGDGTTSVSAPVESNGSGSAAGTHVYANAGIYTVQVTITDKDGASSTAVYQYVVIYSADDGFVTGGGWINSLAGAYSPAPTATGRVSFGFVSKYRTGHPQPDGNTEFNFQAGNMRFHATSYDWLVISGAKAQYRGSGTVNGQSGYSFTVTAWDGQMSGGGGVDKFRIKIVNGSTVVYDNQPGAPDDADPTTPLGGGSIQIHNH